MNRPIGDVYCAIKVKTLVMRDIYLLGALEMMLNFLPVSEKLLILKRKCS